MYGMQVNLADRRVHDLNNMTGKCGGPDWIVIGKCGGCDRWSAAECAYKSVGADG